VFKFFLTKSDGLQIQICKLFFLNTLGFKITNDRVLDVLDLHLEVKLNHIDGLNYKHLN